MLVFPFDEEYHVETLSAELTEEIALHDFTAIQKAMLSLRRQAESDRRVDEAVVALAEEKKLSKELAEKVEELAARLAEAELESNKLTGELEKQKEASVEMAARHDHELRAAKAEADWILEDSDDKYLFSRRGVLWEILLAKLSLDDVQKLLDDLSESDSEEMDVEAPAGGPPT